MKNEPVACDCSRVLHECSEKEGCRMLAQLNTHPAKTLTDEEITAIWQTDECYQNAQTFARAIMERCGIISGTDK